MGHANYQGSMTGETIFGINLLNGEVALTEGRGKVSLWMVLFNYFKMEDKFSAFAELHQSEELGPVLAIIPACTEAERLVQMMNKQVAAFLFYFLEDASLPEKFVLDLITATCDATLVSKISECKWDSKTQTITTPHKKKDDEDLNKLKNTTWWNNAFDLKEMGKKSAKRAADKKPEALFDLDADALSFSTVHERHLKPTFTLDEEDDESEGQASAANPSPATPPRENSNKEAMRNRRSSSATASPPREEVIGDKRAADGG